jgi:hypothetical protein
MDPIKYSEAVVLVVLFLAALAPSSFAATTPAHQTEIHVNLLGQPCLLQGPFDEATLKAIHAMGPAQLYPNTSELEGPDQKKEIKTALEKVRSNTKIPSELERYTGRLKKRFEAQIAFLDAVDAYKAKQNTTSLLNAGTKYLSDRKLASYKSTLKKMEAGKKNPTQQRQGLEQLFTLYNEGIEPDPEAEFHRAIKKLAVQYACSFEESDETGSQEE